MKKLLGYAQIIASAVLLAFVYYVFIVTNQFAPAGLNGIATMIQFKTGFSISYMSLLINIPLSVLAYFLVQKEFAVKTLLFSVAYSVSFLLLQQSGFTTIQYNALGHDTIYPVILSGVLGGVVYGICFRNNASTGGTDILAALINRFKPYFNIVWVLFSINVGVAVMSYFVYGRRTLPVILSILSSFVSGFISDYLLKGAMSALKFEIVTSSPREMATEIMESLDRGCTEIPARGMYSGSQSSILVCVIGKKQRVEMEKIISQYEGSFGFCSPVKSTYGSFRR